jgi:hypothetical protein
MDTQSIRATVRLENRVLRLRTISGTCSALCATIPRDTAPKEGLQIWLDRPLLLGAEVPLLKRTQQIDFDSC